MTRRLYRSREDSKVAGVCGGLGEYFNIDPTFIRVLAVLLIFADGVGLWGYLIAWIVMPRRPYETAAAGETTGTEVPEKTEYAGWNKFIPGAILIVLGVFFIIREHYWWWDIERFWPLLLIIFGVFLLLKLGRKEHKPEEGAHEPSKI